jgi:hypothetical protein
MSIRWTTVAAVLGSIVWSPGFAFAQLRTPNFFGDVSALVDHDASGYAIGVTAAGGFSVGVQPSNGWSLRFEREVPAWHAARFVAPQVRTIANTVLYGRHFGLAPRLELGLLVGASSNDRTYSTLSGSQNLLAATFGADAQIAITPHVAIVPGIRYHTSTFLETGGSITRPRIAVRVRF